MSEEIIKHIDPFFGEIELRKVGEVTVSAYNDKCVYYIIESEKHKNRGLYYKDEKGEIHYLTNKQVEMISRIYDKLNRID